MPSWGGLAELGEVSMGVARAMMMARVVTIVAVMVRVAALMAEMAERVVTRW